MTKFDGTLERIWRAEATSPARARLVRQLGDDWKALYELDRAADAKAGSPKPELTAFVKMLSFALLFVRAGLLQRLPDADFEEVLAMAREHEAGAWKQHRERKH